MIYTLSCKKVVAVMQCLDLIEITDGETKTTAIITLKGKLKNSKIEGESF